MYINVNIHFDLDTDVLYAQSNFFVVWWCTAHCNRVFFISIFTHCLEV